MQYHFLVVHGSFMLHFSSQQLLLPTNVCISLRIKSLFCSCFISTQYQSWLCLVPTCWYFPVSSRLCLQRVAKAYWIKSLVCSCLISMNYQFWLCLVHICLHFSSQHCFASKFSIAASAAPLILSMTEYVIAHLTLSSDSSTFVRMKKRVL